MTLFPRPPSPKKKPKRSKSVNPPKPIPKKTELKPMPIKQEILANIDEHETSQMWILRHLRLYLEDVDDSILSSFVYQQVSQK